MTTERIPIPSEAAKCSWAEDGAAYGSTDPGAGKRDIGWQPKDDPVPGPGEVIPAEGHNFLWRLGMQMIAWLRDFAPREWTELSEGITAAAHRSVFRVVPPVAGIAARVLAKFHVESTATGIGNVYQLRTDGERLYYIAGTAQGYLVVASPVDGAELFETSLGFIPTGLACDGDAVYLGGTAGSPGLRKYDRDGTFIAAAGAEFGHNAIASNGVWAIGALQATNPNRITFWLVFDPTEEGQANDADPVLCVAIDADQGYTATFNAVTPSRVDAWVLSSQANAWSTNLPTTTQPTPTALAADGNYVYAVTNLKTLSAGGSANLYCLNRFDGSVLWTLNVDGKDLTRVAVDDQYLWVVESGLDLYQIRLSPAPAVVGQATVAATVVTDGVCIYGTSGTDATYLYGRHIGEPSKVFMRARGIDRYRRPFFTLAVPVE